MTDRRRPVYMIGVAAEMCNVHPQTLRQYERLGLVIPARVGAKNRQYSIEDVERVKQIQRLTQEMGVNLAGVEIILRLLDDLESTRRDLEDQLQAYMADVEARMQSYVRNSNAPVRADQQFFPVPQIKVRQRPRL